MFAKDIQNYLSRYISFPTVSSNSVLDFSNTLANQAEDLGFQVSIFDSSPTKQNIVAQIGPIVTTNMSQSSLCEGISFCGHMDVVPVEGQNWNSDPFSLHVDKNHFIGRGTCDMKGFFATTMLALKDFNLKKLQKNITLVWTHDEEVGCLGSQSLVQQVRNGGICLPQQTLIGEPTSMNICRMHAGHTTIDIRIQGLPAHSSKPHLGCSAILILAELIQSIQEYQFILQDNPCHHEEMCNAHSLINIAEIQAGSAINIIPEHAHVRIGVRPMPEHSEEDIIGEFEDRVDTLRKKYKNAHITMTVPQSAPAMITQKNSLLQRQLLQILPNAKSVGVPFATDGGRLQDLYLEPVVCGPGSIDMAHKANEFVTYEQLQKSYNTQKQLIQTCMSYF